MDLPSDYPPSDYPPRRQTWELNQARWRLGMDKHKLNNRFRNIAKRRRRAKTPEAKLQCQQEWDKALADAKVLEGRLDEHYQIRQKQHLERVQKSRNANPKSKRQRYKELELARKARVHLQLREAMLKHLEQIPEVSSESDFLVVSVSCPISVLQLVFEYLSPAPGPAATWDELLAHLRHLWRVAAVNCEWRVIALPLLYRTAYVVIGPQLDQRRTDGSGDQGSEVDIDKGSDEDNAFGSSGGDDDEELLNTVGLSRDGVNIRLRSNMGLLWKTGWIVKMHKVQIIVLGMGQTAGQLLRQLVLAGLARHVWPAVDSLRIDLRGSSSITQTETTAEQGPEAVKALNEFLSDIMPSLRKIEFYGPSSKAIYGPHSDAISGGVLIEQLIRERLHGPEPLRAVRVKSDCWPKLTDDYDTGANAPPVSIECMAINGPDDTCLMPVPIMASDTLIELKLTAATAEYVWKLFGRLGNLRPAKKRSRHPPPPLVFSSLQSLVIGFANIREKLVQGTVGDKPSYKDVEDKLFKRFSNLPDYDALEFPVLTRLEFRHSFSHGDLEMFARSPISTLVLYCPPRGSQASLDLSMFASLYRLSILFKMELYGGGVAKIGNILATVCPLLQHLALVLTVGKYLRVQSPEPPFANSLVSLTLEGEYNQYDVKHLLRMFPNLRRLG
ncbi:hypothetical protein IWW57_003163, partial [Coemansia sp. S610]